ncbi:MAG: hypothetical protein RL757_1832 [Bacteroidota bacterium]|jgi:hypothetical protein
MHEKWVGKKLLYVPFFDASALFCKICVKFCTISCICGNLRIFIGKTTVFLHVFQVGSTHFKK